MTQTYSTLLTAAVVMVAHKASYFMTRVTVVAEAAHRGQVGIRASVASHINMSSHGGDGWGRDDLYCPPHRGCGGGFQQGDSCRRGRKEANWRNGAGKLS